MQIRRSVLPVPTPILTNLGLSFYITLRLNMKQKIRELMTGHPRHGAACCSPSSGYSHPKQLLFPFLPPDLPLPYWKAQM